MKLIIFYLFSFLIHLNHLPFIGYLVGSALLTKIEWIIPWVALVLLSFIGGKMLVDGIKHKDDCCEECKKLTFIV